MPSGMIKLNVKLSHVTLEVQLWSTALALYSNVEMHFLMLELV